MLIRYNCFTEDEAGCNSVKQLDRLLFRCASELLLWSLTMHGLQLISRPPAIRTRLAENIKERRILESLLKAAEKAVEFGNPGGLMPDLPDESEPRRIAG